MTQNQEVSGIKSTNQNIVKEQERRRRPQTDRAGCWVVLSLLLQLVVLQGVAIAAAAVDNRHTAALSTYVMIVYSI